MPIMIGSDLGHGLHGLGSPIRTDQAKDDSDANSNHAADYHVFKEKLPANSREQTCTPSYERPKNETDKSEANQRPGGLTVLYIFDRR